VTDDDESMVNKEEKKEREQVAIKQAASNQIMIRERHCFKSTATGSRRLNAQKSERRVIIEIVSKVSN
jgi:hypothetical protein